MKDFRLLFRWTALFGCFLFWQGALLAQAPVDTVYTMADTVVARQLLEEVKDLIGKRKLDEALEKATTAERIYRQTLGEESREMGDVWHQMGRVSAYKGNLDNSLGYYQKSLVIRLRKLEDKHPDIGISYNNLGNAFDDKGDYDKAIEYHQKALEIWLEIFGKEHTYVATSLNNIAASLINKGDYDNAIYFGQKALTIRLKLLGPEHPNVATTYNNLGNSYNRKGDHQKSIEYFEKARKILIKTLGIEHPDVGWCYNNLGNAFDDKGDFDKAIEYHQKALEVWLKTFGAEHPFLATSFNNISASLIHKGDYTKGIEVGEQALNIWLKNLGPEHPNVAIYFNNMSAAFYQIDNPDKALQYIQNAITIRLKAFGLNHPDVATSYNNLGNLFNNNGDYEKAIEYYQKAVEIRLIIFGTEHTEVSKSYNNLGNAFDGKGDYNKATEFYKKSLTSSRYTPGYFSKASSLPELLNALNSLSHTLQTQYRQSPTPDLLAQSHDYALQAIAAIDYQQSAFSEEATKAFWQGKNYPVYEQAIGVSLLKANLDRDATLRQNAFTYAEKGKAGQLQAQFQGADAAKVAGVPDSLLQREHDLRIDIAWREKQRKGLLDKGLAETDTSVLRIGGIVFDLKQQAASLVELLKEHYPDYHDLKYNLSTITVEEVQQQLLRPNEALLEYFVGDSSIFVFVVKPEDYQVVEVKKDFPLEAWVDTLRHNIYQNRSSVSESYVQAATDLYDKLVRPVTGLLPERLIVVPDGVLGYVPFDALLTGRPKDLKRPDRYDYLLKKHQISYCYSATLLKKMRERQHRHAPTKEFAAFSPYYTSSVKELEYLQPFQFSPDSLYAGLRSWTPTMEDVLPASAAEVKTITKRIGGDAFYGSGATEARFDSIAGQYRIVHLATHGIADNRVGDYSFLAFFILPDSVENELLYVRDLYNLELNADMVVLSACETGLGELQRGEGIISLARAFAYAGAKSIVNTLWKVNDQSTSELMVLFYGYLKDGKEKDEALRLAKLAYIKQHGKRAMPFFWAGVIPVGDMSPLW